MKTEINMHNRKGMNRILRVLLCAAFFTIYASLFTSAFAQQTLRGRVLDATTGQPLAGVLVTTAEIKGYSSLTDENGCYEIAVPDYCSALNFSTPDFNTTQQAIGRKTNLPDVSLYPSTLTPLKSQTSDFKSHTSALNSPYTPALTIEEEVQKQMGAQVHTIGRSGTPGIGGVMFVDGLNSLNANAQPLIVVDGVIFDQQRDQQLLHGGFYNDVLVNISPSDIERVTVLRNGTALYGAKGSNGVILIETRRNKSMAWLLASPPRSRPV